MFRNTFKLFSKNPMAVNKAGIRSQHNSVNRNKDIKTLLGDDYFIKSVRTDENDYFRSQTVNQLTRTAKQQIKIKLRKCKKLRYTVTGDGVFERSKKSPQYTKEEKLLYSQPQSFSLVTKDVMTPVFGFNKPRQGELVVIALHKKDVLLSRRLYLYDGGTVGRPYDHDTLEEALEYYEEKVKSKNRVLFADFEEFKQAIKLPQHKKKFNEVLLRARWNTDGSSHLLIASDTLQARLFAQDRARILTSRLRVQANELGINWDEHYRIPIGFYLPDTDKHLTVYTEAEAIEDRKMAMDIYRNNTERELHFTRKQFAILLGIEPPVLAAERANDNSSIIIRVLNQGYFNVAQSLIENLIEHGLDDIEIKGIYSGTNIENFQLCNLPMLNWLIAKCALKPETVINLLQTADAQLIRHIIKEIKHINPNITDRHGWSPLMSSIVYDNFDGAKALLELGANVNLIDLMGRSPLIIAIDHDNLRIAKLLLEAGANPNIVDRDNRTALTCALQSFTPLSNELALVRLLLSSGASPNVIDQHGRTPLLRACLRGNELLVEMLIENGADINKCNDIGETPLIVACMNNDIKTVSLLLAKGAKYDLANQFGDTAFTIAKRRGYTEIYNMLYARMAKDNPGSLTSLLHQFTLIKNNIKPGVSPLGNIKDYCKRLF